MSDFDPGANRHIWETRMASIEEDLELDPVTPAADLLDLVREVLAASGYEERIAPDPEIEATLARAEEVVDASENGDHVRHDDAQQAVAGLRELFRAAASDPEADAGADLRLHRGEELVVDVEDDETGVDAGVPRASDAPPGG